MKKLLSYVLGIGVALLIIAPSINYDIPVTINSFGWTYAVGVAGLFGMLLLTRKDLHWSMRLFSAYLFVNCFLSQAPYLSFNAYLLAVVSFWIFVLFQKCDFKVIVNLITAAFWYEVVLTVFQLLGKDSLMNFGKPQPVFLGTVMNYMRFSSVLALMTPFLIFKSKWYLIPVMILCLISQSSTFFVSLVAGMFVSFVLYTPKKYRTLIALGCLFSVAGYLVYDWGSFRGAVIPSNGGRIISWINILQTWFMDSSLDSTFPMLEGPVNWTWTFFGHGMDTFLTLFPIYKHDMNPFPQAHNCWIQFGWELGLIGLGLVLWYSTWLVLELKKRGYYLYVAGLALIAMNMFFAFPTRMTQTWYLIIAYLALCQIKLNLKRT